MIQRIIAMNPDRRFTKFAAWTVHCIMSSKAFEHWEQGLMTGEATGRRYKMDDDSCEEIAILSVSLSYILSEFCPGGDVAKLSSFVNHVAKHLYEYSEFLKTSDELPQGPVRRRSKEGEI